MVLSIFSIYLFKYLISSMFVTFPLRIFLLTTIKSFDLAYFHSRTSESTFYWLPQQNFIYVQLFLPCWSGDLSTTVWYCLLLIFDVLYSLFYESVSRPVNVDSLICSYNPLVTTDAYLTQIRHILYYAFCRLWCNQSHFLFYHLYSSRSICDFAFCGKSCSLVQFVGS